MENCEAEMLRWKLRTLKIPYLPYFLSDLHQIFTVVLFEQRITIMDYNMANHVLRKHAINRKPLWNGALIFELAKIWGSLTHLLYWRTLALDPEEAQDFQ